MIHVCFCMNDKSGRYSKFIATAMLSLFDNTTSKVTVHLLHDNTLTLDKRDKFSYLAGHCGQTVKFYNVEELCSNEIDEIKKLDPNVLGTRYTIATFYRFFIPKLLAPNIEKAIYLDADTIVNLDIKELWQIELGDKVLASVADKECNHRTHVRDAKSKFLITHGFVEPEDYFVAGILMLNLNRLRGESETIKSGIKFLNENPEMRYHDQDILNYLFSKDYVKLDEKFDVFVTHERSTFGKSSPSRNAIYHYVVGCLNMDMNDTFSRLWMKYFMATPFFDVDIIEHLQAEIIKLYTDLKTLARDVSANVSGKNRAFYIEPHKIDRMKRIFSAHEDEIFISADNTEESLKNLIDTMKTYHGKTIFFIITAKFMGNPFPFSLLNKEGFIEGVDYIKGWLLLSLAPDLRSFVKAM